MLEAQFTLINVHFTVNLFAALVCFSVAWLYFDAWLGRKDLRESTKSLGFFLLSVSFVLKATQIDQSVLSSSIFKGDSLSAAIYLARIFGYLTLIVGQIVDPLQPLPSYRLQPASGFSLTSIPAVAYGLFTHSILSVVTGFLYLRRATTGLEHHLKPIAYSFIVLSVSEIASLASEFRGTSNVDLESLVRPFGRIWIFERITLVLSMLILGRWVWGYLIKRLETQLFMIFTASTLVIFLITAVFFTSVSLINLRQDTLENLEINVAVLKFSIESKAQETLSDAQVSAQNAEIIDAIEDNDSKALTDLATTILLAKNQAFLTIVSNEGKILARADDPEKIGGSLSNDALVRKALSGLETTGVATTDGVVAPSVSVRAAVPVKNASGEQIGAVLVGTQIDNAFLDGLKEATGLDASVYGDNIRSATTFISPDGKSRYVGIREETDEIKKKVLIDGVHYTGNVSILNVPYLAAYIPLLDTDQTPVGMLFVGRPQVTTIQAASRLIEQTFAVTTLLLAISIIPAYFISKYIVDQINA